MNYLEVWEFVSESFEIFPSKLKKFENSLKLPGVLFSISLIIYKNIEEWKIERRTLYLEEQELLKATETFFVQSNSLLEFCKNCHSAFLRGNTEQKRKIVKIVCSNFSYDGSNIVIEPNPVFKVIIKNSISNKKLPRLDSNQQPLG